MWVTSGLLCGSVGQVGQQVWLTFNPDIGTHVILKISSTRCVCMCVCARPWVCAYVCVCCFLPLALTQLNENFAVLMLSRDVLNSPNQIFQTFQIGFVKFFSLPNLPTMVYVCMTPFTSMSYVVVFHHKDGYVIVTAPRVYYNRVITT